MQTAYIWTVSVLIVAISTSCSFRIDGGQIEREKAAAVDAIDALHRQINDQAFDAIYRNASASLRSSQSRRDVFSYLDQIRSRFGFFKAVSHVDLNVIAIVPTQVRAVYNSHYEKGDTTELFVFVRDENQMRLAQYTIFPGFIRPAEELAR